MRLTSTSTFSSLLALVSLSSTLAFPAYQSLGGLSGRELNEIVARLPQVTPGAPPPPLVDDGLKLIYDDEHPWQPLREGDIRGPCPGLNTLASHGYLPRDGVATPAQIIQAVQEGFNMDSQTARFTTYLAHLVDGNLVTDLLSIGGKTPKTGEDTGPPALIAGLNTHSVFEGDASLTRADFFFGDNHSFNQTLFDQFVDYSNRFGGGSYNLSVAGELRRRRIEESIATNPEFDFTAPRFFTAFAESTFPYTFFVDGRVPDRVGTGLPMENATLFFRDFQFPVDFYRPPAPTGGIGAFDVFTLSGSPVAGKNWDGVNTFAHDPNSADFSAPCKLYYDFVDVTLARLYPNPTGILKDNLNINLKYLYDALGFGDCEQLFPYGEL